LQVASHANFAGPLRGVCRNNRHQPCNSHPAEEADASEPGVDCVFVLAHSRHERTGHPPPCMAGCLRSLVEQPVSRALWRMVALSGRERAAGRHSLQDVEHRRSWRRPHAVVAPACASVGMGNAIRPPASRCPIHPQRRAREWATRRFVGGPPAHSE